MQPRTSGPSDYPSAHRESPPQMHLTLPNDPLQDRRPSDGTKTYRIYSPNSRKKSIVVSVGTQSTQEVAERAKIFEASNMQKRNFGEWKKSATAQLPSITGGGTTLDSLADVVDVAPIIEREDPATVQKEIKRLSQESQNGSLLNRKTSRDYTAVRDTRRTLFQEMAGTIIDVDSDEDAGDEERRQAGTDIKGKMKTLKELSEHLSQKRTIRQQLIRKATGNTVLDTEEIPIREQLLYIAEYMQLYLYDLLSKLNFWEHDIKAINGRFGIAIATYFIWLRRLVILTTIYFFISLIGIIIPQIVEDYHLTGGFDSQNVHQSSFRLGDIFSGEGSFHHSYLYYSGYHHRNEYADNQFTNPAFRFLSCLFLIFCVQTYFIFSKMNRYYHSVRMESQVSGVAKMDNFKSIVCAWDFNCHNSTASVYLHKTIRRELHTLATSSSGKKHKIEIEAEHKVILAFGVKTMGLYWGPLVIHITANLFLLICCILSGTILYFLCKLKLEYYTKCVPERDDGLLRTLPYNDFCPEGDTYLKTWILSFPAVFASLTSLAVSKVIHYISEIESWENAENKVFVSMTRAGLMYLTNIIVFYSFWLSSKTHIRDEGFVAETILGKELYRLVVIQGLADITINLGVKGVLHLLRRKSKEYKRTEFHAESNALNMFTLHIISGIGVIFCPSISFFVIARLVADFYHQKIELVHFSFQETYSSHASAVYTPYLLTYFVCYLLISFLNVYYCSSTQPSQFDGPFVNYSKTYDEVISRYVTSGKHSTAWLKTLAQAGFMYTFIIIIGAVVYFCRRWAHAYNPIIEQLNRLILVERDDRDILLKAIFDIGSATFATPLITDSDYEEEHKADEQINKLILHVKAKKSVDNHGKQARRNSLWDASTHHRRHMEMMVAKIVQSRRKSRASVFGVGITRPVKEPTQETTNKAKRRESVYAAPPSLSKKS